MEVLRPSDSPLVLPDWPYEARGQVKYDFWSCPLPNGQTLRLRYAYLELTGAGSKERRVWDAWTGKEVDQVEGGVGVVEETILCLHGEPTWSYLYRKMIPNFLDTPPAPRDPSTSPRYITRRLLAPDFIGFGRSDKPTQDAFYTWQMHRAWLMNFVETHVRPRVQYGPRTTLVVQDWGGVLGLLLPRVFPCFTHMIVMNTGLGVGTGPPSAGWEAFRNFMARDDGGKGAGVDVGSLIWRGTQHLSPEEVEAYRAPFKSQVPVSTSGTKSATISTSASASASAPDEQELHRRERGAKAGVRRFPQLVPILPDQDGVAESRATQYYYSILTPWIRADSNRQGGAGRQGLQVFVCVGESDPVLGRKVMDKLSAKTWGSRLGYWHTAIPDAGHFVQEWAAHIPQLSDVAWSRPPAKGQWDSARVDGEEVGKGSKRTWEAQWVAPTSGADGGGDVEASSKL